MPSISILALCWNHRPFLEQWIASLRAQTNRDFEVIFLDNLSTDGSWELASNLLDALNVPVRLFQNDRPRTASANFNRLLAASKGELIAPMSSDDWYAPTYVERMIAAGRRDPSAGMFACGGWLYFHEEDRLEPVKGTFRSGDVFQAFMRDEQPFFTVGYCLRRSIVEELGGWDEDQLVEDQDFLMRVTRRTAVHQIGEPLVYYRKHVTSASFDVGAMQRGCEAFYAKHRRESAFDMRRWMANRYRAMAAVHVDRGATADAARLLCRALRLKPFNPATYRTALYLVRRLLKPRAPIRGERG